MYAHAPTLVGIMCNSLICLIAVILAFHTSPLEACKKAKHVKAVSYNPYNCLNLSDERRKSQVSGDLTL